VLALNATTDGPAAWATRVGVTNAGIAAASKIAPTNKIHLQVAALLRTGTNLEFMALVVPFLALWEIKQFEVKRGRKNITPWTAQAQFAAAAEVTQTVSLRAP